MRHAARLYLALTVAKQETNELLSTSPMCFFRCSRCAFFEKL